MIFIILFTRFRSNFFCICGSHYLLHFISFVRLKLMCRFKRFFLACESMSHWTFRARNQRMVLHCVFILLNVIWNTLNSVFTYSKQKTVLFSFKFFFREAMKTNQIYWNASERVRNEIEKYLHFGRALKTSFFPEYFCIECINQTQHTSMRFCLCIELHMFAHFLCVYQAHELRIHEETK